MRKNNMKPSSSSSPTCIISNWFSKLKLHKAGNNSPKTKHKDQLNFQHGRFYSMDEDDAYWRLSFGADQGRKSTGGINPLWYDYSDEFHAPVSSYEGVGLRNEKYQNFNEMVSDIKKMREKRGKQKTESENVNHHQSTRKSNRGVVREKQEDDGGERDVFLVEPCKHAVSNTGKQPKIPNLGLRSVKEDYVFEAVKGDGSIPISEDKKLKEIKVKTKYPNKCANISGESQMRNRVKAYSPRTECKIRALEDMKRARMKSKKKMKERKEQTCSVFDSFAVVKSSFNPEKDFRDSMIEMIREKGIARPQQLEQLLACYLTLNSDEYHDLIIKVFRQLWSDLNSQIF